MPDPLPSFSAPAPALSFSGIDPERQAVMDALMSEVPAAGGKPRGRYTAESFQRTDPDRYGLAVDFLAQGYAKSTIAKALKMAWETVDAIERREAGLGIREEKKRIADGLMPVIEQAIEGLGAKAAEGKLSALDVGILIDKHQLLRGEATSISETRGEDPAVAAYRAAMALAMGSRAAGMFATGAPARDVAGRVVEEEAPSGIQAPAHDA